MIKITTLNSIYYVADNRVVKIETDNWRRIHDLILQSPSVVIPAVVGLQMQGGAWYTSTVKSIEEVAND